MARARREFDKLMDEEKELYGDLPTRCESIVSRYIAFWAEEEKHPIETLAVELSFGKEEDDDFPPVEIGPGIFLIGKIDWVLKDHRGVWIADHKTTKNRLPNESARLFDLQTAIYAKVAPQLGLPNPTGVMLDYLKTTLPTVPPQLANGGISVAKKYNTDYPTVKAALKEYGLNEADYPDLINRAKATRFFRRYYLPKPDALIGNLMHDVLIIGQEMRKLRNYPYRNMGDQCERCSYFSLCTSEVMGLDTEYLLKNEYYIDDKKGGETSHEEEIEDEVDTGDTAE